MFLCRPTVSSLWEKNNKKIKKKKIARLDKEWNPYTHTYTSKISTQKEVDSCQQTTIVKQAPPIAYYTKPRYFLNLYIIIILTK